RLNYSIRGQVRSHKIQFLQWVAGCLIRGGLPAMASVQSLIGRFRKSIAGKPPPTVRGRSKAWYNAEHRHVHDRLEITLIVPMLRVGMPLGTLCVPINASEQVDRR
ncbi:hypothetical protein, partial [Pseudomonas viridiflava]